MPKANELRSEEPNVQSPDELRRDTLKTLRDTRNTMVSAAWKIRLESQPEDVKRKAASDLLDVQAAIRALENAVLADIRDKLVANETDLRAGIAGLNAARERLEQVQSVLEAISKVVGVVMKVVSLAAAI